MAKLSLRHVYKIYSNGMKAVDDFNLEINDDEFLVFVGPSGCGKSTTLRMIAGLEDITAGDFYIDGILANNLEPKDRDMAMVFQNYALYPHMSVYENMAFGLRIRNVPKTEIDNRVQEAARILDITDQLKKKPKEMSGGQRQRVALGRAIVRKPKVFLLDEPLSNLDAKLRSSMRSEITRLHNRLKTTFIYVTHDQVEAMTMGTRIVVMKKGVIQQVDTPMNLYDYPSNIFVAGFIGTPQMNFFNANLKLEGEKIHFAFSDFDLEADVHIFNKLNLRYPLENKEVTLGIRPEHVSISTKPVPNSFETEITVVEALGNESNILMQTTDEKVKLTARILRDDSLKIGDHLYVSLNFNKLHLFDKDSTNTLLPRIPNESFVKASIRNNKIVVFDKEIDIPTHLLENLKYEKDIYLSIPTESIKEGKHFRLPIINKEKINDKWLVHAEKDDNKVFLSSEQYVDGDQLDFDFNLSAVTIHNSNFEVIVEALNEDNIVSGKLVPVKKRITFVNSTMMSDEDAIEKQQYFAEHQEKCKVKVKNCKVFDYEIFSQRYEPNQRDLVKIYALLGKQFALHDIRFYISARDIYLANEGIEAVVEDLLDYGNEKYLKLRTNEDELLVKVDEFNASIGDTVFFQFNHESVGIYDNNFGVKLV